MFAMAALGLAFGLRSLVYLFWGADFTFFYTGRARKAVELFAGVRVRPDQLFILGLAFVLIVGVYLLLERTKIGKAMRATADNPDLARVSGIDTNRVILWTWRGTWRGRWRWCSSVTRAARTCARSRWRASRGRMSWPGSQRTSTW